MWGIDHSTPPGWVGELVRQMGDAVAVFDDAGMLVYGNAAAHELLDVAPGELVGTSVFDRVHPDDLGRAGANVAGVAAGARPRAGLLRLRRGDGTWSRLEISPSPVRLPGPDGGGREMVVVVIRDVALQDAHWHFLATLSSGAPFHQCMEALATGLSTSADGPMAVTYDDGGIRCVAGSVPRALTGVTADGRPDFTAGTPWAEALRSMHPAWAAVADLPEPLRVAAEAIGAEACVVVPAPDAGSGRPALLVQWPPHVAMAELLMEALVRRPREAVALALDRRDALRRLEHLAHHDELTGLVNRARFFATVAEMASGGRPYGVCYVDLDRFKPVNDTLGHSVGDHALVVCARRLVGATGPDHVVARLGGDEFAVAGPHPDDATLEDMAARIVRVLGQPFRIGDHLVEVGASVGCAWTDGGIAADAVITAADVALYQAKDAGRGTWRRALSVVPVSSPVQPSLPWPVLPA